MAATQSSFREIVEFIRDKTGIVLGEDKEALLEGRVSGRTRELGMSGSAEYFRYILDTKDPNEIDVLIQAIATNVTHFFREDAHFKYLEKFVCDTAKTHPHSYRIWCAAASSGEEPYTIDITMREAAKKCAKPVSFKILATDISEKVLKTASAGIYSAEALRNMNPAYRAEYFEPAGNGSYAVKNAVKNDIMFSLFNLMTAPPYPVKKDVDVIFCRNVMIYFDIETRQRLVNEFYRLIKPGGLFIMGMSESLIGISAAFKKTKTPSVYVKEH